MASKPYNGHASWNAWNVSLWINNDEGLYRFALDCLARAGNDRHGKARPAAKRVNAASRLFIAEIGAEKTPDGARYSGRSVRAALAGLEDAS